MKKAMYILGLSILFFIFLIVQTIQGVEISNLKKEMEKQKIINEKLKTEMQETEKRYERELDSCLNILKSNVWG